MTPHPSFANASKRSRRETTPLLRRLDAEGLLVSIDADRPINEVTEALLDSFHRHGRRADAINLPANVE